jgi:YrbI family 3-deoxy-D-manno-octulosonate 8-phosphate phosphatase
MDGLVTMNKPLEVLAVIPARGGSKGIPGKNIKSFSGHPLIAYSIEAAKQSKLVTRIIVSTDDETIAAVGIKYGAEVPFMRPLELAQDTSLDFPVFQHLIDTLAKTENYHPDIVVQLRPTSPIRPIGIVDEAIQLLIDNPQSDSVRGVVPSGQNPHKMWKIDKSGKLNSLLQVDGIEEPYNAPRQKLPKTFWQTGHIDAIKTATIVDQQSLTGDIIFPLHLDEMYTIDIDNLPDWERAERLVKNPLINPIMLPDANAQLPDQIDLIVLDFDGVLTDNRVWVDENGLERVAAHRGDGMGISLVKKAGYTVVVLSTETNKVVAARSKKLNIPVFHGIEKKGPALRKLAEEHQAKLENIIYVGNDVNDLPCLDIVGCAVVVADAHPDVMPSAKIVLKKNGGDGAVRELCDMVLNKTKS